MLYCNGTSCKQHFFLRPDLQSRAERPKRQGIQTLSICLLVLSARPKDCMFESHQKLPKYFNRLAVRKISFYYNGAASCAAMIFQTGRRGGGGNF